MIRKFQSVFVPTPKSFDDFKKSLVHALETNDTQQISRLANQLTSHEVAKFVQWNSACWYSHRQYNNILPILRPYISKADGWHDPILDTLRVGKAENDLNGWLGASLVTCVTQILESEYVPQILEIVENSYCDPVNGGILGRDGLPEMLVSMLPYISITQRENWLTMTKTSIKETLQLDDKAIAIANLLAFIEGEKEQRQKTIEALQALEQNIGKYPNENRYALSLLKQKAPASMMNEILKVESKVESS